MSRYIDKDTVVEELERQIAIYRSRVNDKHSFVRMLECNDLLVFLATLKVKEVDLEKEIQQHLNNCLDIKFPTTDTEIIAKDVEYTARKFFELGLQAQKECSSQDKDPYPITIVADRYDGTYSGGKWLAFNTDYHKLPVDIDGDDIACANFWKSYKGKVGKGISPEDALRNLIDIL